MTCARPATDKPRVLVAAAASLRSSLTALLPALERAVPDAQLELTFGASSTLARQVREGAPIDLILSADEPTLQGLEARGLLQPGSQVALLGNELVAIAPEDTPLRPVNAAELLGPSVKRIALPDEAVPIGRYARAWLRQAGLLEKLGDRVVRTEDVRASAAAVEAGEADLAFVYRTDAKLLRRAKVVLAIRDGPRVVYPAAVVQGPRAAAAARVLLALQGPEAKAAFEAAGFSFLPR